MNGENMVELISETSEYGCIVDICWLKGSSIASNDYEILTCHIDGAVLFWKMGKQKIIRDKMYL